MFPRHLLGEYVQQSTIHFHLASRLSKPCNPKPLTHVGNSFLKNDLKRTIAHGYGAEISYLTMEWKTGFQGYIPRLSDFTAPSISET